MMAMSALGASTTAQEIAIAAQARAVSFSIGDESLAGRAIPAFAGMTPEVFPLRRLPPLRRGKNSMTSKHCGL